MCIRDRSSIEALCHPDERWDTKQGCVGTSAAAKLRCGLEEDQREATSCRADDLVCMMRASKRSPRRRVPAWGDPATVPEPVSYTHLTLPTSDLV